MIRTVIAALCLCVAGAALAQGKATRIIVGFPPGGAADITIRIVAQGLATELGQPVVVENRPGAESVIAADAVRTAPPDGTTLFMGTNTAMVAVPSARTPPPYDPFKDFTPVSRLGSFTMFLVVSPALNAPSVAAFLDQVRANPGKLNYASSNSAARLAAVQLLAPQKLDMVHVPYKGDAAALNDLMTDRIQMMFGTGTGVPPLAREGRVRVLATLLEARSPLLPEVPTAAEAGLRGLTIDPWAALFAPAKLPAETTQRLGRAVRTVLEKPDSREQFERQGFAPRASSSEELATFHKSQWDAWTRTVRENNIRFE
jgi:tripartite-type tricarboxylate transporter receptor subunit TctC